MKPMVLTQEAKDNALEIFKKLLNEATGDTDLKINITTETLLQEQGVKKPTVFVTTNAFIKMKTLIASSDKELAWYGTASRVLTNYLIEDIYVYPQTVTSSTVDADEEKCAKWFMELPDEVINKLCFQGHSHVGMTASPSGRDTDNWQKFANLLKPGEFYIVCIGNKRDEFYWNIYDTAINVFFENKDITMVVIDDKGNSIKDWATDAIKKHIVDQTPPQTSYSKNHTHPSISFMQDTIELNGHNYECVPSGTSKDTIKKALAIIPKDLKDHVNYEIETDCYYTDKYTSGFCYSNLYRCFIMEGDDFRARYAVKNTEATKKSAGRPKKNK